MELAFRQYDQDETGYIEYYDLARVSDELYWGRGNMVSDQELEGMMYEACGEKKGRVGLEQFMQIMKKGKLF